MSRVEASPTEDMLSPKYEYAKIFQLIKIKVSLSLRAIVSSG